MLNKIYIISMLILNKRTGFTYEQKLYMDYIPKIFELNYKMKTEFLGKDYEVIDFYYYKNPFYNKYSDLDIDELFKG